MAAPHDIQITVRATAYGRPIAAVVVQDRATLPGLLNIPSSTWFVPLCMVDRLWEPPPNGRILGKAAIEMVSAWASANHLVLGQVKVPSEQ